MRTQSQSSQNRTHTRGIKSDFKQPKFLHTNVFSATTSQELNQAPLSDFLIHVSLTSDRLESSEAREIDGKYSIYSFGNGLRIHCDHR